MNVQVVYAAFVIRIVNVKIDKIMATIKIKFRASSVSGKEGTLYIQVIHQRVVRQVSTKYKLYPNEWDAATQSVVIPIENVSSI